MLTYKRPGTGISVSEIEQIIGKVAKCNIKKDTIMTYNLIH